MPKSASTYLLKALIHSTGFDYRQLCFAYERHEQNLYLPRLTAAYGYNTVSREHTKCTAANRRLLDQFHIKPVVLVRNIFDIVPSIIDYVLADKYKAIPVAYFDESFASKTRSEQIDHVIDLAIPWFIHFYVSWSIAQAEGLTIQWMTYEECVADWHTAITKILNFNDISCKREESVATALRYLDQEPASSIRFNRGRVGRGAEYLSDDQQARIIALTKHYSEIDFARIGI